MTNIYGYMRASIKNQNEARQPATLSAYSIPEQSARNKKEEII